MLTWLLRKLKCAMGRHEFIRTRFYETRSGLPCSGSRLVVFCRFCDAERDA